MKKMKEETGLPVTVEFEMDILWIGARTSVNPFAVQEIAEALRGVDIPVLVKNPINPDLALWLGAVERFERVGIKKLGAIHRGFSNTSEKVYRNRPQWQLAIDFMSKQPDIPMICDPSHICGNRHMLAAVSQKAVDLNYDGLMIESHRDPDNAWSDAKQQITPQTLHDMITTQKSLDFLRQDINEIDTDLINLLGKRMEIARQIGVYKKENNITILQKKRWEEIVAKSQEQGKSNGLSTNFINKLLRSIHDESIDQQEKIMSGK